MKVKFKTCLSGNVFFKKGDEVDLNDDEAKRLIERDIAEALEKTIKKESKKKADDEN